MSNLFTRTFTIPDNASDLYGFCKPGALQDMMQECGNMHSQQLKLSRDDLPGSTVWVLLKAFLRLNRPVLRAEEVTVSTWYRGSAGAQVYRDYDVHIGGEQVGEAMTAWVMFDLGKQFPVRPKISNEAELIYTPPQPKTLVLGKPERPAETFECGTRPVRYSDLDMNGHMNNIKYMEIVCDTLKLEEREGVFLKSAALHYAAQTMPGQTLVLKTGELDGGRVYVSGTADGRLTFEAAVEMGRR